MLYVVHVDEKYNDDYTKSTVIGVADSMELANKLIGEDMEENIDEFVEDMNTVKRENYHLSMDGGDFVYHVTPCVLYED